MRIYRIKSIGGGGLKVDVTGEAGGLRVVGIFLTRSDAEDWIEVDRGHPEPVGMDGGWSAAPA